MSQPTQHEARFIDRLTQFTDDDNRAVLAALRRGLGKEPGEAPEMFPYLVPFTSELYGWPEQTFYLVASLLAWHDMSWTSGGHANFGASYRRLKEALGGQESMDSRFVALLNCGQTDLPTHLRAGVGLCRANDIPVDWAQLLHDLQWWDNSSRSIQREWARSFWAPSPENQPGVTEGVTPSTSES